MEVKYDFTLEGVCKGCPHGHFDIVNTSRYFFSNAEPIDPLPAWYRVQCEHEDACKRIIKLMQEENNESRSKKG